MQSANSGPPSYVSVPYSQLFGEEDADQEVSPDTADPEAECKWEHGVAELGHWVSNAWRQVCHRWRL